MYLHQTKDLWGNEAKLVITHTKPHRAASRDTISHWIKTVMRNSNIDNEIFKPHSTCAAATSAAKRSKVSLQDIMKTAGWKSGCTFAKYYEKQIITVEPVFIKGVLNNT